VIIVRHDTERTHLRDRLGPTSLGGPRIVLVAEFKGLEADNIILYNYFCGSKYWLRLLSEAEGWGSSGAVLGRSALYDQGQADDAGSNEDKDFEYARKETYVALTRARSRLWIFGDHSPRGAVSRFLQVTGAVQVVQAAASEARTIRALF